MHGKIELGFSGAKLNKDRSVKEDVTWCNSNLKDDGEFIIRVKEVAQISLPCKKEKIKIIF